MNNKILIIDDNKMLSKLLAKKIQNSLNCEVDLAFSFAEAMNFENNQYFLSFVEPSLYDAPNGEAIDYMLEKNTPTIVLAADNNKTIYENLKSKDVLDFIFKEDDNCIEKILTSIEKIKHYSKLKVILAMAKLPERNVVKKYLSQRHFNVLAAAHGEEAMSYLNDNNDTKLIIADAKMPVLDGIELLNEVRNQFSQSDLGLIFLGEKDNDLEINLLKNGANDYLTKPFSSELFHYKLDQCLKQMKDQAFLNTHRDINVISGLKNYNALSMNLEDYFNELSSLEEEKEFAFAFLNIDNLSAINEEYGYEVGDEVVKTCANEIVSEIKGRDIVGHYDREKICIVLKNISHEKAIKIFSSIRVNIKNSGVLVNLDELFFTVSIGIVLAKTGDSLESLIKSANEALIHAKNSGKDRVEVCS